MILYYASELAACVGLNRYKSINDSIVAIWARNCRKSYEQALERRNIEPPKPIEDVLKQKGLSVSDLIKKTFSSSTVLEQNIQKLCIENKVKIDYKEMQEIKSHIQTKNGSDNEEVSLDKYAEKLNSKIVDRNAHFYTKILSENQKIGGRIDGLTEDGKLVEIKNRQYRIFSVVPIYEKVQVHAYMFLLGLQECHLVQVYNEDSDTTIVKFDPEFWKSITEKITDFSIRYERIMESEELQDELLTGNK